MEGKHIVRPSETCNCLGKAAASFDALHQTQHGGQHPPARRTPRPPLPGLPPKAGSAVNAEDDALTWPGPSLRVANVPTLRIIAFITGSAVMGRHLRHPATKGTDRCGPPKSSTAAT